VLGAGIGAIAGNTLGKGSPAITALSAGGGILLSESLSSASTAGKNHAYASGYEKGRSDSAKQQYHTLIEQQRQPAGSTDEPATLFDIPLPEREVGGAILKPSTRTLRIQE
jgi:hypothetical protein